MAQRRGRIEVKIGSQQLVDGREDRNRVVRRGIGGTHSVRLDSGNQRNALAGSSSSRNTRRWLRPKAPAPATATRRLAPLAISCLFLALHHLQAAAIKLKQLGYMLLRLGR